MTPYASAFLRGALWALGFVAAWVVLLPPTFLILRWWLGLWGLA